MVRAGDCGLQKAHGHGVWICIDFKTVFLAVIDEAFGDDFAFVKLMIFRYGEQRADRALAVRRHHGGRFIEAKACHGDKFAHGRSAQRGEACQRRMPAQQAIVAQPSAIVDALVFAAFIQFERGKRGLCNLIQRINAVSGLRAARENHTVACGDIAGILQAGDNADENHHGRKAKLFLNEEQHGACAQKAERHGEDAQAIGRIGARAAVHQDFTDALGQQGNHSLRQQEGYGQQQGKRRAGGKGDHPCAAAGYSLDRIQRGKNQQQDKPVPPAGVAGIGEQRKRAAQHGNHRADKQRSQQCLEPALPLLEKGKDHEASQAEDGQVACH